MILLRIKRSSVHEFVHETAEIGATHETGATIRSAWLPFAQASPPA